jgi:hypothetical protein
MVVFYCLQHNSLNHLEESSKIYDEDHFHEIAKISQALSSEQTQSTPFDK